MIVLEVIVLKHRTHKHVGKKSQETDAAKFAKVNLCHCPNFWSWLYVSGSGDNIVFSSADLQGPTLLCPLSYSLCHAPNITPTTKEQGTKAQNTKHTKQCICYTCKYINKIIKCCN